MPLPPLRLLPLVVACLGLLLEGCASRPINPPLAQVDKAAGYRYQTRPPRWEYRLTEKGIDLYSVVVSVAEWGDKHMAGRKGPPVERVHRACGHAARLRLTCEHCGDAVGARDMAARPGPGFRQAHEALEAT